MHIEVWVGIVGTWWIETPNSAFERKTDKEIFTEI